MWTSAAGGRAADGHGARPGGSHLDWSVLAPRLTGRFRVTVPDLLGYGLTTPDQRESTIEANTELVNAFIERVTGGPVVLVGNSMGGLIAARQAAAHPETVVEADPDRPGAAAGAPLPAGRGGDDDLRPAGPAAGTAVLAVSRLGRTPHQRSTRSGGTRDGSTQHRTNVPALLAGRAPEPAHREHGPSQRQGQPAEDHRRRHVQRERGTSGSAGSIRISFDTVSGCAAAWRAAIRPPIELPTSTTGPPVTRSMKALTSSVLASMVDSRWSGVVRP